MSDIYEYPDADAIPPVKPKAPHALTREQVAHHASEIEHCDPEFITDHVKVLVATDAALRQALAQQAQRIHELETICLEAYQVVGSLASDADMFEHVATQKVLDNLSQLKLVHATVLPYPCAPSSANQQAQEVERLRTGQGISSAEMDLSKQLAASQARVRELEAAHFTELKEKLRYTGEYRDAKRKVEQLVTDLDTARQDAARLREAALWAMKKVKRLSTRAVDYKRADDFIQHEEALKGA